ncbi:unnamed protein product [Cyberlindnera jadinii]|uniref:Uncharacterized protein n=1 Tax=Cyberlindnera jadinii (strain ATCC 18201 / CBS 1600 / BCRC 20928 / JCM 3617 / NBRC 0987 / NRRL Y-1542) TaxID=983966 RepID=A0A0H5C9Z8_CYBJN|nr:unnamed protein product [Cyberlindnera jadinii]
MHILTSDLALCNRHSSIKLDAYRVIYTQQGNWPRETTKRTQSTTVSPCNIYDVADDICMHLVSISVPNLRFKDLSEVPFEAQNS